MINLEQFIGRRIYTKNEVQNIPYISKRSEYLRVVNGMEGTIVRISSTGKIGIQFDAQIFSFTDDKQSALDCGCHGKGKVHHCIYLPIDYVELNSCDNDIDTNTTQNNRLLLLV